MSFKDFTMNLVTLGGYEQLETAKASYASAYNEYESNRNRLYWLESTRSDKLSGFGGMIIQGLRSAKVARKFLYYTSKNNIYSASSSEMKLPEFGQKMTLENVDRVMADYSSSVSIAGGTGAGAALAAGSWSMVALVGSASTGTAISTLSGVAATNATLAWFGGGALAAGGAGMAGGTLVLGGVALLPVMAIAAWHSRSKTKEINLEIDKVRHADMQTRQAIEPTQSAINAIDICSNAVSPLSEALQSEVCEARKILFPVLVWSFLFRFISNIFGRPFYSNDELELLNSLEIKLFEFISHFEIKTNNTPQPFI